MVHSERVCATCTLNDYRSGEGAENFCKFCASHEMAGWKPERVKNTSLIKSTLLRDYIESDDLAELVLNYIIQEDSDGESKLWINTLLRGGTASDVAEQSGVSVSCVCARVEALVTRCSLVLKIYDNSDPLYLLYLCSIPTGCLRVIWKATIADRTEITSELFKDKDLLRKYIKDSNKVDSIYTKAIKLLYNT